MLDMLAAALSGVRQLIKSKRRTARNKPIANIHSFDLRLIDKDAAMAELVNQIIEFAQATNSLKSESVRFRSANFGDQTRESG